MTDTIPRGQRLEMAYAGADWLKQNLVYAVERGAKVKGKPVRSDVSPLGATVAEALGFVYRGLYHLPWPPLERAEWWNDQRVEVSVSDDDLATWDWNLLTVLVVVCHDLGLRLAVHSGGPRRLKLYFTQRTAREGDISKRMPTIEDQIATIREAYRVLLPGGASTEAS
jgi:hypothetical protein